MTTVDSRAGAMPGMHETGVWRIATRRATMARLGIHVERAQKMSGTRRIARARAGSVPKPDAVERPSRPRGPDGRFESGADARRRGVASRPVRRNRLGAAAARIRALPPAVLAGVVFAILIAGLTFPSILSGQPAPTDANPAGVGQEDFSFAANGVKAPTGRKPEAAKLWFNDGSWWGELFRPSRDAYTINRFDVTTQQWIDTGTIIDDRNASRADVVWDGTHLYAISGGTDPTSDKDAAVLDRFSYDAGSRSYSMDRGFPIRITDGGAETFVLDRADDGQLWVTFTHQQTVFVSHSLGTDRDWTRPFPIPLPQAINLTSDDIAAVTAYEDHIGVMWSDQTDGAMYFAEHANGSPDDAWSVSAAIQGPALADDHMNLKSLRRDPAGLVFAVVKTSRNDAPNARPDDPLIVLLVLNRDGVWEQHVIGTVDDEPTRPLLLIDTDHRVLHVFFSAPCCSGGTIYSKTSSLDDIQFDSTVGTPVIRSTSNRLNNPTSTKQNVNAQTGLLIIASDDRNDRYMHSFETLAGPPDTGPSPAPPLPGPSSESGPVVGVDASPGPVLFEDTFESGTLSRWTSVKTGPGSTAVVETAAGRYGQDAAHLEAGSDEGAFAYARVALPSAQATLTVGLDVKVHLEGPLGANVPLLRLFDSRGKRLVTIYRQNASDSRLWIGLGSEHIPTQARLGLDTWGHLAVEMRRDGVNAATVVSVRLDGRLVAEASASSLPSTSIVEIGNDSANQPFDIFVDDVRVSR
jgi:hypothetical protein